MSILPTIHPIGDFDFPRLEKTSLSNGIPLCTLPFVGCELVRVDVIFPAGTSYQEHFFVTNLTHSMLKEGTVHYTSREISEMVDFHGASLTSFSTKRFAGYSLQVMEKSLPQLLSLLKEVLMCPVFPESDFKTLVERKKQKFAILESRVTTMANRGFMKAVFGEKGTYAWHPSPSDYDDVQIDWLKEFHQRFYRMDYCQIMLSGCVNENVRSLVDETFGTIPIDRSIERPTYRYEDYPTENRKVKVVKPDSVQSAVVLGRRIVGYHHPDYFKLGVLNTILGGYFGSRLMSNIREDKGYTYGINSVMHVMPESAVMMILSQSANEYVQPMLKEIYKEMDRLCEELVSEEELSLVKNYKLGEILRSSDGSFSIADAYMSFWLEGLLDDLDTKELIAQKTESIRSITAEEIRDLARKYLRKEDFYEVIAGA